MPFEENQRPWETLKAVLLENDKVRVQSFIRSLASKEIPRALSGLTTDEGEQLLMMLDPDEAARLVDHLPQVQSADLLSRLHAESAADILEHLPSDERANLISEVQPSIAEDILDAMAPEQAREARDLQQYPPDVAGGMMIKEYLSYPVAWTIAQVLDDFRQNADRYRRYNVQYAYVSDLSGALVGVLRLRDLLLARGDQVLEKAMLPNPTSVRDTTSLDELRVIFDNHHYLGMPVVNDSDAIVGVLQRVAVESALAQRAEGDYIKSKGIIGGEELRSMPLFLRSRRRLLWLCLNVFLNLCSATVISWHQDILQAVIALAVFMPIISDMSGCAGNQAIGVSMRELTLGILRPGEMFRVLWKELSVGLLNGVFLGIFVGLIALLWKGSVALGIVVGAALAINTVLAMVIGGIIPLVVRKMKGDPALISGPILTTVTDTCGFFLALTFASMLMPYLVK